MHWMDSRLALSALWLLVLLVPVFKIASFLGGGFFIISAIMAFGPFATILFQKKSKKFVVTNKRIYIEEGIFFKTQTALLFLDSIKTIKVIQNFFEKIINTGTLEFFVGHEQATIINQVVNPNNFKNELLNILQNNKDSISQ